MKQFSKELGKVSITPKGDWNSSIANEKLDIVYDRRNNQAYIAKQDVPIGVDIDNREYWQPLNATGYADNNFINLTAENENGTITAYESLEEAVATIFPINRRVGATLSFYNLNADRLDRQAEFELWQFNSTDLANWENKDYWNNIYYNWNVFAGWYIDADALNNHVNLPNVGQYAYVGSNLNDAILYQCRTNGTWTNTGIKVRNYISVVVNGNITIGENGNWFSDGEDTGIPATPSVDEQLDNIIAKHESLSRTVQGIAVNGGASTATNVTYNNDNSGLNAENAQDAIDELQGSKFDKTSILQESGTAIDKVMSQGAIKTELDKKANTSDVDIKFTEEKNRVDTELDKKENAADVDSKFTEEAARVDAELDKKADKTTMDTELAKKADKTYTDVELNKKFDKESVVKEAGDSDELVMSQKSVTDKLNILDNNKFDKNKVVQESGEAEDKVMSQKATTTVIADETTRAKAAEKTNAETITNEIARLDEKINDKTNEINVAKEEALQAIAENEQSAIANFNSQRVTPEMLSESTKQLIEASGGGTITNFPDEEDLTINNSALSFKNLEYDESKYVSTGKNYIRKRLFEVADIDKITKYQNTSNQYISTANAEDYYDGDVDGIYSIIQGSTVPVKDEDGIYRLHTGCTIYGYKTINGVRTLYRDWSGTKFKNPRVGDILVSTNRWWGIFIVTKINDKNQAVCKYANSSSSETIPTKIVNILYQGDIKSNCDNILRYDSVLYEQYINPSKNYSNTRLILSNNTKLDISNYLLQAVIENGIVNQSNNLNSPIILKNGCGSITKDISGAYYYTQGVKLIDVDIRDFIKKTDFKNTKSSNTWIDISSIFKRILDIYHEYSALRITIPCTFGRLYITEQINIPNRWIVDFNNSEVNVHKDFTGDYIFNFLNAVDKRNVDYGYQKVSSEFKNLNMVVESTNIIKSIFNVTSCPNIIRNITINANNKCKFSFWQEPNWHKSYPDNKLIDNVNVDNIIYTKNCPQAVFCSGDGCVINRSRFGLVYLYGGRGWKFTSCINIELMAVETQIDLQNSYFENGRFIFGYGCNVNFGYSLLQARSARSYSTSTDDAFIEVDTENAYIIFDNAEKYCFTVEDLNYLVEDGTRYLAKVNSILTFNNCNIRFDWYRAYKSSLGSIIKCSNDTKFIFNNVIWYYTYIESYELHLIYSPYVIKNPELLNGVYNSNVLENVSLKLVANSYTQGGITQSGANWNNESVSYYIYNYFDSKRKLFKKLSSSQIDTTLINGYRYLYFLTFDTINYTDIKNVVLLLIFKINDKYYSCYHYIERLYKRIARTFNTDTFLYDETQPNDSVDQLYINTLLKVNNNTGEYGNNCDVFNEDNELFNLLNNNQYNECTKCVVNGDNITAYLSELPQYGEWTNGDEVIIEGDGIYKYYDKWVKITNLIE